MHPPARPPTLLDQSYVIRVALADAGLALQGQYCMQGLPQWGKRLRVVVGRGARDEFDELEDTRNAEDAEDLDDSDDPRVGG